MRNVKWTPRTLLLDLQDTSALLGRAERRQWSAMRLSPSTSAA
jgi:hypothetical protein